MLRVFLLLRFTVAVNERGATGTRKEAHSGANDSEVRAAFLLDVFDAKLRSHAIDVFGRNGRRMLTHPGRRLRTPVVLLYPIWVEPRPDPVYRFHNETIY